MFQKRSHSESSARSATLSGGRPAVMSSQLRHLYSDDSRTRCRISTGSSCIREECCKLVAVLPPGKCCPARQGERQCPHDLAPRLQSSPGKFLWLRHTPVASDVR